MADVYYVLYAFLVDEEDKSKPQDVRDIRITVMRLSEEEAAQMSDLERQIESEKSKPGGNRELNR